MKVWFRDKPLKYKSLLVMAAGLVLLAVLGVYYLRKDDSTPNEPAKAEVITISTDTPAETKPDSNYKWRGGPDDPKYIKLPTVGTEGFIQNVSVDQKREVAVPNNIHFAGWFVESVRPGQTGLSIIDGHVDGRQEAGIFQHLADLKENDEYTVEMGGGNIKSYRVKKVVAIDTKDAASILFSQDPEIKSQLNLITCGGSFDRQSRQYDKRVIVISKFIE